MYVDFVSTSDVTKSVVLIYDIEGNYRIEEPILHLLWGYGGFLIITSPNPNFSGWNLEYYKRGYDAHAHKKWGKSPQGFRLRVPKLVLCLSNAAFWPLILHWFRPFLKQKTWISVCICTLVKNFQKQPKMGNFDGVLVRGVQLKRHNFGQWESFRGLLTSQNPKDVPFVHVREFWWGTYGLGAISPRKAKFWRSLSSTILCMTFYNRGLWGGVCRGVPRPLPNMGLWSGAVLRRGAGALALTPSQRSDPKWRWCTDCIQQLTMTSSCSPFTVQCHWQGGSTLSSSLYCRGRHLYLAGRPSRWALAHISSYKFNAGSALCSERMLKIEHFSTCEVTCRKVDCLTHLCTKDEPRWDLTYGGSQPNCCSNTGPARYNLRSFRLPTPHWLLDQEISNWCNSSRHFYLQHVLCTIYSRQWNQILAAS